MAPTGWPGRGRCKPRRPNPLPNAGAGGYRPTMDMAEALLLLAVVALPPALGVLAARARKPWWWAAAAAVAVAMVAAIAPEPEAGESRVAAGDVVFLLVVALWVAGLAWLGFFLARRFWVRRDGPQPPRRPESRQASDHAGR